MKLYWIVALVMCVPTMISAVIVGGCQVETRGPDPAAIARFKGVSPRNYRSCVINDNCLHEVHVLGVFGNGGNSRTVPGNLDVVMAVNGSSSRRLILVLSSFFPIQWRLRMPAGVIIDIVILTSFLDSSVVAPPGQVLAVENLLRHYTVGPLEDTEELLDVLYDRFGSLSSFTDSRNVNEWRLTLTREDLACTPSVVPPPEATTPSPVPDLRFIGGENRCEGILGVPLNDRSSSYLGVACNLNITNTEAMVICRQMGCIARGAQKVNPNQIRGARGSEYTGLTVAFNTYVCTGREHSLHSCRVGLPFCRIVPESFIGIICGSVINVPTIPAAPPTSSPRIPALPTSATPTTWRPPSAMIPTVLEVLEGSSSISSLTPFERQCVGNQTSRSSFIMQCLASSTTISSLCISGCFGAIENIFISCTRREILQSACDEERRFTVSSGRPPSGSVPSGVWFAVGGVVPFVLCLILCTILYVRYQIRTKRSSAERPPTSNNIYRAPERVIYMGSSQQTTFGGNTDQPNRPPHLPPTLQGGEGVASLTSNAPPSYAEVEANKDQYATSVSELPPPYPGVDTSYR